MIPDEDVLLLYRCLLGRPPESPDIVRAFQSHFDSFEAGRAAILVSDEFRRRYRELTGKAPPTLGTLPTALAGLPSLAHAPRAAPERDPPPERPVLSRGFSRIFSALPEARVAVVLGEPGRWRLSDLLPWPGRRAVILHIVGGEGGDQPRRVPGQGTVAVYRMRWALEPVLRLLGDEGLRIDALLALGPPADAAWIAALRTRLAERALLLIGPGEEMEPVREATGAWATPDHQTEWRRLLLRFVGGWHPPVEYAPAKEPPAPVAREAAPRLALVAILRDEANSVLTMLASALPVASAVVLIDAGSADDTLARARNFLAGTGLPHVLGTMAPGRFDAMRNTALDQVPADIEWVLMLDGDEALAAEDHAALLRLITQTHADAFALPRYNFPGQERSGAVLNYPDRQVRLFRHTPDRRVRFVGAIEERLWGAARIGLVGLDWSVLGGSRGGPHLHHLTRRYRSEAQQAARRAAYEVQAAAPPPDAAPPDAPPDASPGPS